MGSGKLPNADPTVNVTFSLTENTNAELGLLVYDPVAGRARYGLKSKFAEALFSRLFRAVVEGKDEINVRDLRAEILE